MQKDEEKGDHKNTMGSRMPPLLGGNIESKVGGETERYKSLPAVGSTAHEGSGKREKYGKESNKLGLMAPQSKSQKRGA